MTALLAASAVALVLPLALGLYAVVGAQGRQLAIAHRNLTRGLSTSTPTSGSLESRGNGRTAFLRTITPDSAARRVRTLLQQAGSPPGWTMTRVLAAKPALSLGLGLVTVLAAARGTGPLWLVALAAAAVGAYWLPDLVLRSRGDQRRARLTQELPDVLDQMTIAVQAGLGFEAAMTWVAANGRGMLAEEFRRTMADIQVGRPRRDAYAALVARAEVDDLRRFVAAVNQADSYGIAVSDVLRVQASEMRIKRRQRAEEKAMKVPVKVSFPLMLCILPALVIVVLGPAIVSIGDVLG